MPPEPQRQDQILFSTPTGCTLISKKLRNDYHNFKRSITHSNCTTSQNRVRKKGPTCTLGSGGQGRPWWSCAPFSWSREQYSDLILHIGVQMPQFVVGRVNDVGLCPGACGGAVLHLLQDDGAISNDGVGVWLNPQVGGPHSQQLWRGDGRGRLWKTGISKGCQTQMVYRTDSKHVRTKDRIPHSRRQ